MTALSNKADLHSLGLLVMRLWLGLCMAYHGWGKFAMVDRFTDGVAAMGFPFPVVFAWAAILSEFVGGLLIALGFKTRVAAFFVACTMGVAFFITHGKDAFQVKELALAYGAAAIVLMLLGGGNFSADKLCPCGKKC